MSKAQDYFLLDTQTKKEYDVDVDNLNMLAGSTVELHHKIGVEDSFYCGTITSYYADDDALIIYVYDYDIDERDVYTF